MPTFGFDVIDTVSITPSMPLMPKPQPFPAFTVISPDRSAISEEKLMGGTMQSPGSAEAGVARMMNTQAHKPGGIERAFIAPQGRSVIIVLHGVFQGCNCQAFESCSRQAESRL